ncbi:MAG: tRNA (adenosine(37)-N6)-dimethylallyltransferase MiaA [Candidatus Omnitrophica bacterium]|nr:tRNA (adenosine(37)-N6)-dimethylallyltransferase MiaA [Candidatus Omnitrophota bacterium]
MEVKSALIVLVGPTASGKSELALALAQQLGGEIVSADSMQVYRGMDIGTNKPSPEERRRAPHHGLDLVEPQIEFTVAMYRRYALGALSAIRARGRIPILVGGTGLYIRAVVDGLCPAPPADPACRQALAREAALIGADALHARLRQADPVTAARVHPHDARRVIRALEVYRVSGRPLSAWHQQTEGLAGAWEIRQVGLLPPREALDARINARVRGMVAAGLVEEARALHAAGVSRTAAQALGYKELFAAFEGRWGMDEAIARIQRETRRYARRQLTWFRRDARIAWLTPVEAPRDLVPQVRSLLDC